MFVSSNVSSGMNFLTSDGVLTNNTGDTCLIFPLHRIISNQYSFNVNRTDISHLGSLGTISRPILNNTEINLSFDYFLNGLANDVRLGLYCNIPSGDSNSGPLLFGNSNRTSILFGLYTRDDRRSEDNSTLHWPPRKREPKSLFLASKQDTLDFNNLTSGSYRDNVDVYAFGNCYLNTYKMGAGVGQIPQVSVSFVADNLEVHSSGINLDTPAINPQTYNVYSGIKFSIPNNFEGTGLPTVLLPQDITVSIKQRSNNSENLTDLFLDYTDIKLQNFNFDFSLNRNNLYAIGYKFPLDKQIQFPVIANLNFNLLPGDNKVGSLVSLIKRDENYDINIKLKYQSNERNWTGVAIQYDFIGAKFNGFNDSISISERKNNTLSFSQEINPLSTGIGLFISGFLSIPSAAGTPEATYLSDDFDPDGSLDNLLTQDSDIFTLYFGGLTGTRILY